MAIAFAVFPCAAGVLGQSEQRVAEHCRLTECCQLPCSGHMEWLQGPESHHNNVEHSMFH